VALVCNPSYSGDRDQEDHGSKPAQANVTMKPYLKRPFTKIELVEDLEFKPQYCKKNPKKQKNPNKQTNKTTSVSYLQRLFSSEIIYIDFRY
jgi:hypothetical protein